MAISKADKVRSRAAFGSKGLGEGVATLLGGIASAAFVIGAEAGNVINVGIDLKDVRGASLGVRTSVLAYFSDDANGDSVVATAPSGAVAIGTDGVLVDIGAAKKNFILHSEADGDIDINITEAGVKTMYLVLVLPNGTHAVSGAITFA